MIKITCDGCGVEITGQSRFEVVRVEPSVGGGFDRSDVRNHFCLDCW